MIAPQSPLRRSPVAAVLALCLAPLAAWADCAADFARDNRVRADAGPFRTVEERVPMSLLDDGRWVPTLRQSKVTSVTEAVPARQAFRFITDAPISNNITVVGQRGWQQDSDKSVNSADSAHRAWTPLDADTLQALAGALDGYLTTDELADLSCSAQALDGRAVRAYRFTIAGSPFTGRTTVSAQFDAQTGLPLAATVEATGAKNRFTGTTRFSFDRAIRVAAPKSAGKP